jgi:hypothetical protein
MKLVACLLASSLLSACTIHVHVHDDAERESAAARHAGHLATQAQHGSQARATDDRTIGGVVHGADGAPVHARIAVVGKGGSMSTWTDKQGRFSFSELHWPEFALHASTEDGRIAVAPAHPGEHVELVLAPGGTLEIDLDGMEKTRCAVFSGDLRVEDFTLKSYSTVRVVVPAGDVRVELYSGDTTYEERTVRVARGETAKARFEVGT